MPKPRKRQVSLEDTPYYHCISRCVRRAFLCGIDPLSGFDFSHRRDWIVKRMKWLSTVFAVDICAYAVMSNHYHIVLRVNRCDARTWSDREVAERWLKMFQGPWLVQRWLAGVEMGDAETDQVLDWISERRSRLYDLSWYMRCLNEAIARMANKEDHCKGRFWEGRFKSQALLDERALLTCMAYVDLNPIRAGMAQTPETSDYTSVQERIKHPQTPDLRPFGNSDGEHLPFSYESYLQLVDWTGRTIRKGKHGQIPDDKPPILARLRIETEHYLHFTGKKPNQLVSALGSANRMRALAANLGLSFIKGITFSSRLFPERS